MPASQRSRKALELGRQLREQRFDGGIEREPKTKKPTPASRSNPPEGRYGGLWSVWNVAGTIQQIEPRGPARFTSARSAPICAARIAERACSLGERRRAACPGVRTLGRWAITSHLGIAWCDGRACAKRE